MILILQTKVFEIVPPVSQAVSNSYVSDFFFIIASEQLQNNLNPKLILIQYWNYKHANANKSHIQVTVYKLNFWFTFE